LGSQPNKVSADSPERNAQHFVERVWVNPTLKEDGEAGSPEIRFGDSFLSLIMTSTQLLLTLLIIWGIPSTYFRSKFRKIVYQTDDWKINIQPLFKKEIVGLFSNMYPENPDYIKTRNQYRIYLLIYLFIFILYQFIKT
jgi:peroxiredoxin Q/BCP